MEKVKTIISVLITLLCAFPLSACGGKRMEPMPPIDWSDTIVADSSFADTNNFDTGLVK